MTELITDGALKALARFGCIDDYRWMGIDRDIRRCIAQYRLLELERIKINVLYMQSMFNSNYVN